jgi:hypothetical protein
MATIADIDEPARLYVTSKSQQLSSVQVPLAQWNLSNVQFSSELKFPCIFKV